MNACILPSHNFPKTFLSNVKIHNTSFSTLSLNSTVSPSKMYPLKKKSLLTACSITEEKKVKEGKEDENLEQVTKRWGLELGLWKALTQKNGEKENGGNNAKALLAKYGMAYISTSIFLSIISFSFFYLLIDSGVDVHSFLANVGINVDSTGEKVGTVALAYAAHKAASPIRFPPTVFLTPVVANLMGKNGASTGIKDE